jgi:hypothetical protein
MERDIKRARKMTNPREKKAFVVGTDSYFEEQVSHVPRYDIQPDGSEPLLRWAPLMLSHKVRGWPAEPRANLPGWDFPPEPQGETTSALIVDEALVDSYLPRVAAR